MLDQIISNQFAILHRLTNLEGNFYAIKIGEESIHTRLINMETKAINFVQITNEEFDSLHDQFRFCGEAMEMRMNRTVVQLSKEVKFVAWQVHDLSLSVVSSLNRMAGLCTLGWQSIRITSSSTCQCLILLLYHVLEAMKTTLGWSGCSSYNTSLTISARCRGMSWSWSNFSTLFDKTKGGEFL